MVLITIFQSSSAREELSKALLYADRPHAHPLARELFPRLRFIQLVGVAIGEIYVSLFLTILSSVGTLLLLGVSSRLENSCRRWTIVVGTSLSCVYLALLGIYRPSLPKIKVEELQRKMDLRFENRLTSFLADFDGWTMRESIRRREKYRDRDHASEIFFLPCIEKMRTQRNETVLQLRHRYQEKNQEERFEELIHGYREMTKMARAQRHKLMRQPFSLQETAEKRIHQAEKKAHHAYQELMQFPIDLFEKTISRCPSFDRTAFCSEILEYYRVKKIKNKIHFLLRALEESSVEERERAFQRFCERLERRRLEVRESVVQRARVKMNATDYAAFGEILTVCEGHSCFA